jgi:hypothetical protein
MKKFLIISWILFFLGFTIHLLHWPGADLFMLLSCTILIIHNIIFMFKNVKKSIIAVLSNFMMTMIAIYVIFRFMNLPFSILFFILSILLAVIIFIIQISQKKPLKWVQLFLILPIALSITIFFTKSDQLFYITNCHYLSDDTKSCYFGVWDRYSWYLYCADKKVKALEANQKAIEGVSDTINGCSAYIHDRQLTISELEQRKLMIINNTWTNWVPLSQFNK